MNNTITEAVTLVAAANAFKTLIERFCFVTSKLCYFVSTYVLICYSIPACLFIVGGKELSTTSMTIQPQLLL